MIEIVLIVGKVGVAIVVVVVIVVVVDGGGGEEDFRPFDSF